MKNTSSPFQFELTTNLSLFSCPKNDLISRDSCNYTCLTDHDGYEVYAEFSNQNLWDVVGNLISCSKMYEVSVPSAAYISHNYVPLSWSIPSSSSCRHCAAKGEYFRLKNNSTHENNCYFIPKQSNSEGLSKKLLSTGIVIGFFLLLMVVIVLCYIYKKIEVEKQNQTKIRKFLDDYKTLRPTRYSYGDLKKITNQFEIELGRGAYGTVFKGKLSNEIIVAVKVLNIAKGNGQECINEVETMCRIQHFNVVRLIGFCADGLTWALVYEYLPNDTLQKFISSPDEYHFLGWKRLHDIALGVAQGIEYLHQGCEQRVLHFDIKPHNILLDENFNPKVSDFGLAKLCSRDHSAVSMTTARGTIGYIAPEVFSRNFGNVSHKSDVYSYGMVVLEMVGGRKNVDLGEGSLEQVHFVEWIYNLLEEGEDLRFGIEEEEDFKIAKKLMILGLWCIRWNPIDRPSMKIVVQMLEGEGDTLTMPPNPFNSTKRMTGNIAGRRLYQDLEAISEIE